MDEGPLTPSQFMRRMLDILEDLGPDTEEVHRQADDVMCELLRDLGYGEGVAVFCTIEKWYA
jgi:hypothetical protein